MAAESLISKLATEALTKAVEKTERAPSPESGTSFQEVLAAVETGGEGFAKGLGIGTSEVSPGLQIEAISGELVDLDAGGIDVAIEKTSGKDTLMHMLETVNHGQSRMDTLVNHVLYSDRKFSNQELLVIQAQVYHFAQMTELTVKVAEQGVSSVKTVLNTQIQ